MQDIEIETQCEDPGSRGQQPGDLEGGGEGRAVVVEADVGEGPEDEDHHRHHQQRGHGGVVPNLTHSHTVRVIMEKKLVYHIAANLLVLEKVPSEGS